MKPPSVGVVCLALCLVASTAIGCNCNYGNVDVYEPQCLCSCYSGYLLPNCLYKADDVVAVQIWLTLQPLDFFSDQLLQTLAWALPVRNATELTFLYAHPYAQYNRTAAFVTMLGDRAQQLVWDFSTEHEWLAEANIEAVWEHIPPLPESSTYGSSLFVYQSTDGKVLITVEGIMWLIGALSVMAGLSILESCCLSNNEEEVWDYVVEHHAAMTNLVDGDLVPTRRGDIEDEDDDDRGDAPSNPLRARPMSAAPSHQRDAGDGGDPHRIFSDRTRR